MKRFAGLVALLLCTPAVGQTVISADELRQAIAGRSVTYSNSNGVDGVARFGVDGRFDYRSQRNEVFRGFYSIHDGRICITLVDRSSHCDAFYRDGDRLMMRSGTGRTFTATVQ